METCPICMDDVGINGGVAKLKECNHRFCHDCIFYSFQHADSMGHELTCPMCRAATSMSSIRQCVKGSLWNEEEEFVRPASFFFKNDSDDDDSDDDSDDGSDDNDNVLDNFNR